MPLASAKSIFCLHESSASDDRFQGDVNRPFFDDGVVDRGDRLQMVADGEARRQLEFAEQFFFDDQLFVGLAGQRVGRNAFGQHPPRRGVFRQGERNGCPAVFAGDDCWIPVGGFTMIGRTIC